MRVARLHGIKDVRIEDEDPPRVPAGSSLVRVSAVGLCGSDLHWFTEGAIGDAQLGGRPLVLGHEFAGVVEGGPLDGRRVAVDPAIPDFACEPCLEGNHNLCLHLKFAGHGSTDGGLREYVAWPDRRLHPIPDSVSDAGGAVLEPLGVALHAFDLGHVKVASSVAVVGCGPIGLLMIQVARASGARRVLAVEPLPHRRAAARSLGADAALTPAEAAESAAAGQVEVAFEAAGTDDAVDTAMRLARPGARVVLAGIPDADSTTFSASLARRKGLTLVLVRRMKEMYPRAISLAERGLVDLDAVVGASYPITETAAALTEAAARTGLKVIVRPAGTRP
ncbi:MAG TPA: alcohol dehydrogenase catalytic domain-containing protein [Streptosporangiaceae bacterium]